MRKSVKAKLFSTLAAAGIVASLTGSGNVVAATCTAILSNSWTTPGNWSCGAAPTPADNVVIPTGVIITVPLSGSPFTVKSIALGDGSQLTGGAVGAKVIAAGPGFPNSVFNTASLGIILNDVELEIGPNHLLQITSGASVSLTGTSNLIVATTAGSSSIGTNTVLSAASSIRVANNGKLNIGTTISGVAGSAIQVLSGGVLSATGSSSITNIGVANAGEVNVQASQTLTLSNSPLTMSGGASLLSGTGTLNSAALALAAGTVSIFTITGNVNNTGAVMSPAGPNSALSSININGTYTQTSPGSIEIDVNASSAETVTATAGVTLISGDLKLIYASSPPQNAVFTAISASTATLTTAAIPIVAVCPLGGVCRKTTITTTGSLLQLNFITGFDYTVNSTSDALALGTLRSAISAIAAEPICQGPYTIKFNLPALSDISPSTALPALGACQTTVDGWSNLLNTSNGNGLYAASNAAFGFRLSGSLCSGCDGLTVGGGFNVGIQGLHIDGFTAGNAITLAAAGASVKGVRLTNNSVGIFHGGSAGILIGGLTAPDKNVMYRNGFGIHSSGQPVGTSSTIVNNIIGFTESLAAPVSPGVKGIYFQGSSDFYVGSNTIGHMSTAGVFTSGNSRLLALQSGTTTANRIFDLVAGALAIDLDGDGITLNDGPGDADGAGLGNSLSNYPEIRAIADNGAGGVKIYFKLDGLLSTSYAILVCQNVTVDRWCTNPLVESLTTTDGTGTVSGFITVASATLGQSFTLIARVISGVELGNTSEISPSVSYATPVVSVTPSSIAFGNQGLTIASSPTALTTITITNTSPTVAAVINPFTIGNGTVFYDSTLPLFNRYCGFGASGTGPSIILPVGSPSCNLPMTFLPITAGANSGTLTVNIPGLAPVAITQTGTGVAMLTLGVSSISFGNQTVGVTSLSQPVTVTNTSGAPLTITSITPPAQFGVTGPSCVVVLAIGASCTINVQFTPAALGLTSAISLMISFASTSATVGLSGNGVAPNPTVTPALFNFGNQVVATASAAQAINVTNPSSILAITFGTTSISAPFSLAPGGTCGGTLAASSTCFFNIVFTPSTLGSVTGVLNIPHSGPAASVNVGFSGTGGSPPPLSLTPTFTPPVVGLNAPSVFTLLITNSDAAVANGATISFAPTPGAAFVTGTVGSNCGGTANLTPSSLIINGASIPGGGSCSVTVNVSSPTAALYNINLPVGSVTSAIGGQVSFTAATLTVISSPSIIATPASGTTIDFGTVLPPATSAPLTRTLQNTGTTVAIVSRIITGANAGVFNVTDACGGNIAPAGNCVFSITCTPGSVGPFSATFSISHDATNIPSPVNYPLACVGGTPPPATATLTPSTANLGAIASGETRTQTYTYANTSTSILTISSVTVSGTGFSRPVGTAGGNCPAAGAVAASTSCTVIVQFSASALGAATGTVSIASNANASPHGATVSAQVVPVFTISPATQLDFGQVASNATSAAQSITVTNNKTSAITLSSFVAAARFAMSIPVTSCATSIPALGSCTYSFTFAPIALGVITNSPQFSTSANIPLVFNVRGEGVAAAAPVLSFPSFSLNLGQQVIGGQSQVIKLTATNSGTGLLSFFSVTFDNTQFRLATLAEGAVGATAETTKLSKAALNSVSPAVTIAVDPPCIFSASASIPPGGSCVISVVFTPTAVGPASGTMSITHNAAVFPATSATAVIALTGAGVLASAPVIQISPANPQQINFGNQTVSTTSTPARIVTIGNIGTAPLNILAASISNSQFSSLSGPAGGTCAVGQATATSGVAPNTSCTIHLVFTPTAVSSTPDNIVGQLSITHDAVPAPTPTGPAPTSAIALVDLVGTGIAALSPKITVNPLKLAFGEQVINTSSAAKTVTVTNSGDAPLTLNTITVTGGNNIRPVGTLGGTCSTTVPIAPSQTCTITLIFNPSTTGDKTGTLGIQSNASNLPAGTNGGVAVSLAGTGIPVPKAGLILTPRSLAFGAQTVGLTTASQPVQITNSGNANLTITGIIGAGDYGFNSNCPLAPDFLIPAASCAVNVNFTPQGLGARDGAIIINSNAELADAVANRVALSGAGFAVPVPELSLSTTSLRFGSQTVGSQSEAQALILSNIGLANLIISGTRFNGDAGFISSNNNVFFNGGEIILRCGSSLAPSARCYYAIAFAPSTEGSKNATFTISTNLSAGASVIILSGTATPRPSISITPQSLDFGAQTVGLTTASQRVQITNSGNANLTITGIIGAGDYGFNSNCPLAPDFLIPTVSCAVNVNFTPLGLGARGGAITINSNAELADAVANRVALSGAGFAVPVPELSLSTASLRFGSQTVGSQSEAQALILSNIGLANLIISGTRFDGDAGFISSNNNVSFNGGETILRCGSSLAPSARCYYAIAFAPSTEGSKNATFTISTNLSTGASVIILSGTATSRPRPSISITPQSLDLGNQTIFTRSNTSTITISNSGDAPLTVSNIFVEGQITAEFFLASAPNPFVPLGGNTLCASIVGTGALAPAASCIFYVSFDPTTEGVKSARITIASDAANAASANSVDLSGTGTAVSVPRGRLSSTALGFGNTLFISTAQSQTITLTSVGTAPLDVNSISILGDFTQTNNCPSSLVVNASCNIIISFTPRGLGSRTSALRVNTNMASPLNDVTVGGTSCRWFSVPGSRTISTLCAP